MKTLESIHLSDVQTVYSGPEGRLWELIMGQQVHLGGFASSKELAGKARIAKGYVGVDLCCCNGAGMRFLVKFCGVGSMTGVDATKTVLEQCRQRCQEDGFDGRITCIQADVCKTELPSGSFDFVWGEDAWCYVEDKNALIREAARIVKPGGTIAFTDWVEGEGRLSESEAARFMAFMKFPSLQDISGYRGLLEENGFGIEHAADTGRFGPCMDLYIDMVQKQLMFDVLKVIGYDQPLLQAMSAEMEFMRTLAHAGKIAQGLFVARKLG